MAESTLRAAAENRALVWTFPMPVVKGMLPFARKHASVLSTSVSWSVPSFAKVCRACMHAGVSRSLLNGGLRLSAKSDGACAAHNQRGCSHSSPPPMHATRSTKVRQVRPERGGQLAVACCASRCGVDRAQQGPHGPRYVPASVADQLQLLSALCNSRSQAPQSIVLL